MKYRHKACNLIFISITCQISAFPLHRSKHRYKFTFRFMVKRKRKLYFQGTRSQENTSKNSLSEMIGQAGSDPASPETPVLEEDSTVSRIKTPDAVSPCGSDELFPCENGETLDMSSLTEAFEKSVSLNRSEELIYTPDSSIAVTPPKHNQTLMNNTDINLKYLECTAFPEESILEDASTFIISKLDNLSPEEESRVTGKI